MLTAQNSGMVARPEGQQRDFLLGFRVARLLQGLETWPISLARCGRTGFMADQNCQCPRRQQKTTHFNQRFRSRHVLRCPFLDLRPEHTLPRNKTAGRMIYSPQIFPEPQTLAVYHGIV